MTEAEAGAMVEVDVALPGDPRDEPVESLRWWDGEVVATVMETPRARTLTLEVPGWAGHAAGQYVDLRWTTATGYQSARSYSIASPPEEGERLRLTVDELPGGEVSPALVRGVHEGDVLAIRGPLGADFSWSVARGGPLLLIAGGSGIVPLMAMLRHRALTDSSIPARLVYSTRTARDLIYRAELTALAADDPRLDVVYTLTRGEPSGWSGYRRRIDVAMLSEVVWPADQRPLVYVAGSTRFVEAIAGGLLDLGYDPERISTEWFSPT